MCGGKLDRCACSGVSHSGTLWAAVLRRDAAHSNSVEQESVVASTTFVEAVQAAYDDSDACALPWSTLDYDLDE